MKKSVILITALLFLLTPTSAFAQNGYAESTSSGNKFGQAIETDDGEPFEGKDEVIMLNGDKLTGKIVNKDGDTLTFETKYTGEIKIDWAEVKELKAAEPVTVLKVSGDVAETSNFAETATAGGLAKADADKINPDDWELGKGYKLTGQVNVGLKFDRGNTDQDEIDADARIVLRTLNNRFTVAGELENDEADGEKTKDKYNARAIYDRFLNKRTFLSALATVESDKFADLDTRYRVGPAVGYQFYEEDDLNLFGLVGPMYVSEDYKTDPDNEFWSAGWAIRYDQFIIKDILQIYHMHSGNYDVEGSDQLLFDAWTGVNFPIYMGFVIGAEWKFEYNSEPATGAKESDNTYRFKFGYSW